MIEAPSAALARIDPVAWAMYAGGGDWIPARHHVLLGDLARKLLSGEILRLVVSMPPRSGKSEFLSRYLPTWWLGAHPKHRVMIVSMKERLSRKYARASRDDLNRHGEALWGITCHRLASTVEWDVFQNHERTGGGLYASSVGGGLPGYGADLAVVDDMVRTLKEAKSQTIRDSHWEWLQSLFARLHPPGRVVVLMTRWHHDDVIGRLQQQARAGLGGEPWTFVNLPAIAEDGDLVGRKPGEALWPERGFTVPWLNKQRLSIGSYMWEANYCGRPTAVGGGMIKWEWFRSYRRADAVHFLLVDGEMSEPRAVHENTLYRFATVDLAATTKTESDYTVIASWGYSAQEHALILLDVIRERLNGDQIIPAMQLAHAAHRLQLLFVERAGNLLEEKIGDILKEAARVLPIHPLPANKDKVSRAVSASPAIASGQVFVPRGADWLEPMRDEVMAFPGGRHDDTVDALTYAVALFQEWEASSLPARDQDDPGAQIQRNYGS